MYSLILPLGIINMVLVIIQMLSGLRIVKISFKAHKRFGIMLAVGAFLHAAVAIVFA